jgi:hypothetical protein
MNRVTISRYAVAIAFAALLMISAIPELYSDDLNVSTTCSNTTLKGPYGFNRTGDTADGPFAAVGRADFDGNGNFSLRQHVSRNGAFQFSKGTGRIQIDKDCTLRAFNDDGREIGTGIVVDDGNGFFLLNRTTGNAVVLVARKIHSN